MFHVKLFHIDAYPELRLIVIPQQLPNVHYACRLLAADCSSPAKQWKLT